MVVVWAMDKKRSYMADINEARAMSLAEACASVGKRPEQFPANKQCACGCVLSRYNPYDICSACQRAIRKGELRKVTVSLPRRNGHTYWSASVVAFSERIPLTEHEQTREDPSGRR